MKEKPALKKVLIAAGGTGGHILPALSIAECLVSIDNTCDVQFVCGSSELEKNIYSQFSFTCHKLLVGRLRSNVGKKEKWKTIFSLPFVLLKSLLLILRLKPDLVLGTGGAVSGPILLAAFLLRRKTIIFEANTVPGLANRWLSYFVDDIIIVFDSIKKQFKNRKHILFPFPVRSSIGRISLKDKADSPLQILVLGGSQGSSIINKVVSELVISQKGSAFSFVHQTGYREFEHFRKMYSESKQVKVLPFLNDIHKFYEWADVVVGRAGTGTISEISASGRAGILVPLASSADQHQSKNAQDLEKKSAAIVIEEKDLNKLKLEEILENLRNDSQKINQLSSRIHELKLGATADSIADYLLGKVVI